jgi:hypothetical protein
MLKRWEPLINDTQVFINSLDKLIFKLELSRNKRSRPPKHDVKEYFFKDLA